MNSGANRRKYYDLRSSEGRPGDRSGYIWYLLGVEGSKTLAALFGARVYYIRGSLGWLGIASFKP